MDGICNGTNGFVKADHKKSNETRIKKSALMRVEELGEEMDEDEEGRRSEGLGEDVGKQVRRRVKYLKRQKGKDDIKELGIPEAHLEGIKEMMTQKESTEESVRGSTMQRRQEREREAGPKGERNRKRQKTSKSPSKEKRRAESPLCVESKTGMFSEVRDNITVMEESVGDDIDETLRQVEQARNKINHLKHVRGLPSFPREFFFPL